MGQECKKDYETNPNQVEIQVWRMDSGDHGIGFRYDTVWADDITWSNASLFYTRVNHLQLEDK
jgi:hypothetical protein